MRLLICRQRRPATNILPEAQKKGIMTRSHCTESETGSSEWQQWVAICYTVLFTLHWERDRNLTHCLLLYWSQSRSHSRCNVLKQPPVISWHRSNFNVTNLPYPWALRSDGLITFPLSLTLKPSTHGHHLPSIFSP